MPVKPIYQDFFKFLDAKRELSDPWKLYVELYLNPHKDFLLALWREYKWITGQMIKRRIEKIDPSEYDLLRTLLKFYDLPGNTRAALKNAMRFSKLAIEPDFYLFCDPMSPDGVVVWIDEKRPTPGIGIDRWREFSKLPILVAHVFKHWEQDMTGMPKKTLRDILVREGEAVYFSRAVYPDEPLHKHFFLTQDQLEWLKKNEEKILAAVSKFINHPLPVASVYLAGAFPVPWKHYVGYKLYLNPKLL